MRQIGMLTFAALLCSVRILYAQQAPGIEWQKCYGGDGKCIVQTFDSGYAIAGSITSTDSSIKGFHPSLDTTHPTADILLIKLNSSGAIQWQKCYGGSGEEAAYSIIQTSDHGFAIAGQTTSKDGDVTGNNSAIDDVDGWIIKIDTSGNIEWEKCFGTENQKPYSGYVYPYSIIQNTIGEYVVAGAEIFTSEGCYPESTDAFVIKLDSSGKLLWQQCYGGTSGDKAWSIIQTYDGGYCFAGETASTDGLVSGYHVDSTYAIGPDIWVVKINSSGGFEWQKCLGGSSSDYSGLSRSIVQTADSGFVIGGSTGSSDGDVSGLHNGSEDAWVVKVNSSGAIQWQKCYGGKFTDGANSLIKTSDGGFVFTGVTNSDDGDVSGHHPKLDSTPGRTRDIWVVKLNSAGVIQWQKCLGGSGNDEGYSIIETKDGGYALTGITTSNDGDVSGIHPNGDMWIVKLKAPMNSVENSSIGSSNFTSVYPNPSTDEIHLQLYHSMPVQQMQFYNLLGAQYFPEYQIENTTASVDVHNLPVGSYIVRVLYSSPDGGNNIEVQKFLHFH
jgi:hypothetical protein